MEQPEIADTRARLRSSGAAAVYELLEESCVVDAEIHPLEPGMEICGPAFTVAALAGDNLALHRASRSACADSIIVASTGVTSDIPLWGETLTLIALSRGLGGLIIDTPIRDSRRIRELGFPVVCRGTAIRTPSRREPGTLGATIVMGGVEISSGDWVIADDDGVVVIPAGCLTHVLNGVELAGSSKRENLPVHNTDVAPSSRAAFVHEQHATSD